jgi:hypothetical protein
MFLRVTSCNQYLPEDLLGLALSLILFYIRVERDEAIAGGHRSGWRTRNSLLLVRQRGITGRRAELCQQAFQGLYGSDHQAIGKTFPTIYLYDYNDVGNNCDSQDQGHGHEPSANIGISYPWYLDAVSSCLDTGNKSSAPSKPQ